MRTIVIYLILLFLCHLAMGQQRRTILTVSVLDRATRTPLDGNVKFYLNSDFIVHHSGQFAYGRTSQLLDEKGFYLIEVSVPGYLQHQDTVWLASNDRRQIVREFLLTPIERGVTFNISSVNFYFNSVDLTRESHAALDSIASIIRANPSLTFEVAGHTDDEGDANYNLSLSKGRAETIVRYLVKHGVEEDRLLATGYGEEKPIDKGATKSAKARNRRVEFLIAEISSGLSHQRDL